MACWTLSFSFSFHVFLNCSRTFGEILSFGYSMWILKSIGEVGVHLKYLFLHTFVLWTQRICVGTLMVDTEHLTSPHPLGRHLFWHFMLFNRRKNQTWRLIIQRWFYNELRLLWFLTDLHRCHHLIHRIIRELSFMHQNTQQQKLLTGISACICRCQRCTAHS